MVEKVAPDSAAELAGFRAGDRLLSWSRGDANGGPVRSPFDLHQLEIEQAPQGAVTLHGLREDRGRDWVLPPGLWGLEARPTFPEPLLALYRQGRDRIAAGGLKAGARPWRSAIEIAGRRQDLSRAAWLQGRLSVELAGAGRWAEADAAAEKSLQRLQGSQAAAALQLLCAWSEARQNNSDRTAACYRRALASAPAESLAAAWDLHALGSVLFHQGDLTASEDLMHKALAIQERLAPGSINLAWTLESLSLTATRRGELDTAEREVLKALEITRSLAPESLELAQTLRQLGTVAYVQGDLSATAEHFRQALALAERLSPNGIDVANLSADLGMVDLRRGDLAAAEKRFRRTLTIREKLAPKDLEISQDLDRLGFLAEKRGDFTAAEEHYRRALDVRRKLAPSSPNAGYRLENLYHLAAIEKRKGNLAKADKYLQQALEILERSEPEGHGTASALIERARIAAETGNLILAEKLYLRVLAIQEKQAPESYLAADSLESLGGIAFQRGELAKAEELFRRALAIREKISPTSTPVGMSLNDLGKVYRRTGRLSPAAESFCQATGVFDRQREKLGGTLEGRSTFSGTVASYYQDCVDALMDLGRREEAFSALERGRARSFLDLLANRDVQLTDLPPELARDRKQTDAEYDRTQAALTRLSPARDQAEINRLSVQLREIQARQEEIAAKVRLASPRTAALHDPRPLSLAETRAALDPGTVLLEYAVGPAKTWLFVVEPADAPGPGLAVFPVAAGQKALRKQVESFRRLLNHPGSDRAALQAGARQLYDLLVRPAAGQIDPAQRILLSPDGPLHTLPFAALRRGDRYLVEWKPIHSVLSATVYAELKRSRPEGRDLRNERLVAFGDPKYPLPAGAAPADPEVRESLRRGLTLRPIPSTRKEVEAIAALYPQTHTYLGREATEERAKSLGPGSRLIHFACHGVLDERFPLSSALALTVPEHPAEGQDNGLLQAWEIFESMRLDADLVTLSACDTALGKEMGGEGLVGLTRAFQYAGARSVLASLWGVADYSTARFMKRFYGYLRNGKTKDEALRAAQIDQIRKKGGSSHPFFWAAFELTGDWR